MGTDKYITITSAEDLTDEILRAAEGIYDGWFSKERSIDWNNFLDRLDGTRLENGTLLDMGDDMLSPAIKALKAHIREYKSQ